MRYWTYTNNEIGGPFEKEQLAKLITRSSLICPETPAGGQTNDWKEASTYPEVSAILPPPAPAKPRYPESESPLALTMRGSLITDEAVAEPAFAAPAAGQPPGPGGSSAPPPEKIQRPAESPLALTMRGSLISDPAAAEPAAGRPAALSLASINALKPAAIEPPDGTPKPPVPGKTQAIPDSRSRGPDPGIVKQKVEQVGGALAMIRNSQAQMLEELKHLESAVAEIRALLSSETQKK